MKITIADSIVAEGSEQECAVFVSCFLYCWKSVTESEQKQKIHQQLENLKKLDGLSIKELMQREMKEEGNKPDEMP